MLLLHGTRDTCAPLSNAEQFAAALEEAGADVKLRCCRKGSPCNDCGEDVVLTHLRNSRRYPGETHTSPLIENPMRGGRDKLTDDILAAVLGNESVKTRQLPLNPGWLIDLAAFVCPF